MRYGFQKKRVRQGQQSLRVLSEFLKGSMPGSIGT